MDERDAVCRGRIPAEPSHDEVAIDGPPRDEGLVARLAIDEDAVEWATMGVATVFEVAIPASNLALAETFERAPDARFRVERTVDHAADRALRFAWISGIDADRVADLLATDPTVTDAAILGDDGDAHLFEVEFGGGVPGFLNAVFERDGAILRASATDGVWQLQLRFGDRADVGEVFDHGFRREYDATVTRLHGSLEGPGERTSVTEKQRQALATAFEMGYYSVPRAVDLRDVGDRLDISRQAVSERLRRAHELLVGDFLGEDP